MDRIISCDVSSQEHLREFNDNAIIYWVHPQCQASVWLPITLSAVSFLLWVRCTLKPKPGPPELERGTITRVHATRDYSSIAVVVLVALEILSLNINSVFGLNFYSTYLVAMLTNQLLMMLLIWRWPGFTTQGTSGKGAPDVTISQRILNLLVLLDLPIQSMILTKWFPISFNAMMTQPTIYIYSLSMVRLSVTGVRAYYQNTKFIKEDQLDNETSNLQDRSAKPTSDVEHSETTTTQDPSDDDEETTIEHNIYKTLYAIFTIVRPHINYTNLLMIFGVSLLRVVEGLLAPIGPLLAKYTIDQFTAPGQGDSSGIPYGIWFLMFLELVRKLFFGSSGIIELINNWATTPIDNYIEYELSHTVMIQIHKLSIDYHLTMGAGKLESIMNRGISNISRLVRYSLFEALPDLARLLCGLTLAYNLFDPRYYIILGFGVLLHLIITYTIEEYYYLESKAHHDSDDDYQSILTDSLTNFESVKMFTNEVYEATRYKRALRKRMKGENNMLEPTDILETIKAFSSSFITFLISAMCAYDVKSGKRSVSDLALLATFVQQINQPLVYLTDSYQLIIRYLSAIEKLVNLIQEQPSVQDPTDKRKLVLDEKKNTEIVFDQVTFTYKKEGNLALKNISFKIPSGKVAALVGPSGGGKSTIIKLLLRWYDPQSGSISIGGQRIDKVTQGSLRKIIGVVPQDTILFNDTIAHNIKYGNLEASSEDIVEAAKLAQIHDRIQTFTNKYDTVVGERGLRLSGGEKQRVAIARAFVRKPSIILLDEATSALDTETERKLQNSLNQLTENRTALIIAHRLSTIIHADIIFCIQDGTIAERGTHQELLALGGVYAKMWHSSTQ